MAFGIPFDSQFDNRYIIPNKIYHRGPGIINGIPNTEFCDSSNLNAEINYSRPRKAKSARFPVSRMQK
jgi:hypothetical protein